MEDIKIPIKTIPKKFYVNYLKSPISAKNKVHMISNSQLQFRDSLDLNNNMTNNLNYHKLKLKPLTPVFKTRNKSQNLNDKIIYCYNHKNNDLLNYIYHLKNFKPDVLFKSNSNKKFNENLKSLSSYTNPKLSKDFSVKKDIQKLKIQDLFSTYYESQNFIDDPNTKFISNSTKNNKENKLNSGQIPFTEINIKKLEENINKLTSPFIVEHFNKTHSREGSNNILTYNTSVKNNSNTNNIQSEYKKYSAMRDLVTQSQSSAHDAKNNLSKSIDEESVTNKDNKIDNNHSKLFSGLKRIKSERFMNETYRTNKTHNLIDFFSYKNNNNFYPSNKNKKFSTLYKSKSSKKFYEVTDEKNNIDYNGKYKPIINLKELINNLNASKNDKNFNIRFNKVQDYTIKTNLKLAKEKEKDNKKLKQKIAISPSDNNNNGSPSIKVSNKILSLGLNFNNPKLKIQNQKYKINLPNTNDKIKGVLNTNNEKNKKSINRVNSQNSINSNISNNKIKSKLSVKSNDVIIDGFTAFDASSERSSKIYSPFALKEPDDLVSYFMAKCEDKVNNNMY